MYRSSGIACVLLTSFAAASGTALASPAAGAQVCTLGTAAVGQPAAVLCKDVRTGATTQQITVGNTVVGSGGTGGTLSRHRDAVLVTNVAGGAVLFEEVGGRLVHP